MRLKILYFADHKSPHTRRWAEWMLNQGHIVTIFSLNGNDKKDISGMPYASSINLIGTRRINNRILRLFIGYFRALFNRLTINTDIIHAHSTGSYLWLAGFTGLGPLVVTPWGKDLVEDLKPSRWEYLLTKLSLMRAVAVTTDGAHLVPILKSLKVESAKIYRHEWGVDTEFYLPSDRTKMNEGKGIQQKKIFRIVSTRTPTPVHDVECLIRAAKELLNTISEFEIVIVGDGSTLQNLKAMAHEYGIQDKIIFTGMLDQYALLHVLQSSDLYVSTSPVDAGLSVSTAEAMSCGLAVVHPDVADNANWTPEGIGGFLYPPGDSLKLCEAILSYIRIGEKNIEFGMANRNKMIDKNDKNKNMKMIENLYLSIYKC